MPEQQIDIRAGRANSVMPFRGEGDHAAWLPASARKKFKVVRARAEEALRTTAEVSEKRTALRTALDEAQDQLEALTLRVGAQTRSGRDGHGLADDSANVRTARMQLASMSEDLADLDAVYADKGRGEIVGLFHNIERFLERRSSTTLRVIHTDAPILKKGTSIPDAIEATRRRLRELEADLQVVDKAPWPSVLTKQLARVQLEELAKRGVPDVFGLVERCEPIDWPSLPVTMETAELPQMIRDRVDVAALVAWALGPALGAAIEREIDRVSDDANALMPEQRRERRQQILVDMLAAEREEEALIELAESRGIMVRRRSNADPRAVLGIAGSAAISEEPLGHE